MVGWVTMGRVPAIGMLAWLVERNLTSWMELRLAIGRMVETRILGS